jgi:hypothetical protein
MNRIAVAVLSCLLCLGVTHSWAQSPAPARLSSADEKGWTAYLGFQGSSNTFGQVMDLDSNLGYNFGPHFSLDGGVPIYFVRGTDALGNSVSNNGLGDMYANLRLKFRNPTVNYFTTLTGYAPTGDTASGLSTGRAMWDWNNRFDRSFGRLTPFVEVGIGDTVPITRFYNRPYTTLGYNTQLKGGVEYALLRYLSVGAAGYAVAPWGQQKVFSKLNKRSQLVGGADLARDNGFNTWMAASPSQFVDLELGYDRSVHYSLNTLTFGLGFNVGRLFHQQHASQ